ncbi:16S rRNA (guanine(966)-N(2))-methyltransferase RsmD [Thiovibrio frasassiensis]|uniref:16S rRNA (Guanine(966)-N(2))-methyltransferase RsmD n=1 Tax=Thiovibrio frasassiensis TaxID=2984131 RepID=A0A9X4RMR9_9BACT|nr:16S rRNA (guanine(966)-N(2))-methyltransferase RsmD [Thiovibrio frasassiensis]MDG4476570.1 16S rRNA (guanine(966)-N(2))-methyltransferase RsmD [Thiovibrio frasassiensis]
MRIISGSARGRKLLAPGPRFGALIRPTSDRAREAIFSILAAKVVGARVLDLFAGTGALGLEALSRGALLALFVDGQRSVTELIERNVALCAFTDRATVLQRDLGRGLDFLAAKQPVNGFDLVFLDPPYGSILALRVLECLAAGSFLGAKAIVVLEDAAEAQYPQTLGVLTCFDRRRYGEAGFWLYHHTEAGSND